MVSLHDSDLVQSILYKLTMTRLQKWTADEIDQHIAILTILILQDGKWQTSVSLVEFEQTFAFRPWLTMGYSTKRWLASWAWLS